MTDTDELTGNLEGYDPLFGGDKLPGLFDKTHGVGTSRTGIITKVPTERQSRTYKAGGSGDLKYWAISGEKKGKPVTYMVDPLTNTPLKPVMDTVFTLQTDYRLTPGELAKREMDPEDDTGLRGVFAGGADLKAIRDAIRRAGIKNRPGLVGKRLTMTRTGQKIAGDFEAWEWHAEITDGDSPAPDAAVAAESGLFD